MGRCAGAVPGPHGARQRWSSTGERGFDNITTVAEVARSTVPMNRDRDVAVLRKAGTWLRDGWLGRMHREIADRVTLSLALRWSTRARACARRWLRYGYLLRRLAVLVPTAVEIAGIDAAPGNDDGRGSRVDR